MSGQMVNHADDEFFHHASDYLKAGGTQHEADAMKQPDVATRADSPFGDKERLVFELVDTMTREVTVPDALFERPDAPFPPRELTDLVATVAAYNMVSRVVVARFEAAMRAAADLIAASPSKLPKAQPSAAACRTVGNDVSRIMQKLHAPTHTALAAIGLRQRVGENQRAVRHDGR